jgi:hypothetical protein
MSCVLRVGGAEFDVDAFLQDSPLAPDAVFHRGQPMSGVAPESPVWTHSGYNLGVSDAEIGTWGGRRKTRSGFSGSTRRTLSAWRSARGKWTRRVGTMSGIALHLGASFWLAIQVSLPLMVRSAEGAAPPLFAVMDFCPPDRIGLRLYRDIGDGQQACEKERYLLPASQSEALNQALAAHYTGVGGTWAFEIVEDRGNRQYIHVVQTGDDDVIESWYWATTEGIEPEKFR